jgi:hypothetical protein
MARRLPLIAAAGMLLAAAAPAAVPEEPGPWAVTVRVGAHQPAELYAPDPPGLGVGPSVELAGSYAVLPWLEVELAAGWARSTSPTEHLLVRSDPADPMSPLVQVSLTPRLTTVPLNLGLRLAWPSPLRARPYLVAAGGVIYAEYGVAASTIGGFSTGWGSEWCAGVGVETQVGTGLVLGLEARWRRAHATLHQHHTPPLYLSHGAPSWQANLGGGSLQATLGWAF